MIQMNRHEFINYGTRYNVGIFYKDIEWARNIFDILYKKLDEAILKARKSRTGIMDIELYGGIRYQFVYAGDNARGHKFNKVFIQEGIKQDIIDNIIEPSLYYEKMVMLE